MHSRKEKKVKDAKDAKDAMDGGFLVHLHSPNQTKTIGKWWFNGILMGFTLWESNMAMGNTGKSPNHGGL